MKRFLVFCFHVVRPLVDPRAFFAAIKNYPGYFRDVFLYWQSRKNDPISKWIIEPCLADKSPRHGFSSHYAFMGAWALENLLKEKPSAHVDVGGDVGWACCASRVVPLQYIDIRKLDLALDNFQCEVGSVLSLPYGNQSIGSISCLHVAEHVGLGRYGDPLDPLGTRKAITELSRALKPGGKLYFALPVGSPMVRFNTHRIHDPETIVRWFAEEDLRLVSFAGVGDDGRFERLAEPRRFNRCRYACGMYVLERAIPEKK